MSGQTNSSRKDLQRPPPLGFGRAGPDCLHASLHAMDLARCRKPSKRSRAGSVDTSMRQSSSPAAGIRASSCMAMPQLRRGRARLADWSVDQVASWAALLSLPLEVAERLRENAISGQVLETLTEDDLIAVGLDKFGWRRQLLLCRRELCEQLDQEDRDPDEDTFTMSVKRDGACREDSTTFEQVEDRLSMTEANVGCLALAPAIEEAASWHPSTQTVKVQASDTRSQVSASSEKEMSTSSTPSTTHPPLDPSTKPPSGVPSGGATTPRSPPFTSRPNKHPSSPKAGLRAFSPPGLALSCGEMTPRELSVGNRLANLPAVKTAFGKAQSPEPGGRAERYTVVEQKAMDAHHREVTVPVESAGIPFRVDNSRLRSGLDGLEFHRSMSLSDGHGGAFVRWGSLVYGTPMGSDWIKVGELYLPTKLNGVSVLTRLLPSSNRSMPPKTLLVRSTTLSTGTSIRTTSPPPPYIGTAVGTAVGSFAQQVSPTNAARTVVMTSSTCLAAPMSTQDLTIASAAPPPQRFVTVASAGRRK